MWTSTPGRESCPSAGASGRARPGADGQARAAPADEPTSALDVVTAGVVCLLSSVADAGTAMVVGSNDERLLAVISDRVPRLAGGRLTPLPQREDQGSGPADADAIGAIHVRAWRAVYPVNRAVGSPPLEGG